MLVPGPYKHPPQQLFSSKLETTDGQVVTGVIPHLRLRPVVCRDCFPAPNLERRRYAHQCPLVVHECLQVGNDSIEFGAGS